MVKFLIHRGHDGPSREGQLDFDPTKVSTPLLTGSMFANPDIEFQVLTEESSNPDSPVIVSLGSLFHRSDHTIPDKSNNQFLLLPSLPSTTFFKGETARYTLDIQYDIANSATPSDVIIRVPSSIHLSTAKEYFQKFHDIGVRSAAFSFVGNYSNSDFDNLVLRTALPRNWIVFATGMVPPASLPLLYLMGFDIFDMEFGNNAAAERIRLWPMVYEHITTDTPRFCSCSACSNHQNIADLEPSVLLETLQKHNSNIYKEVLSECVLAKRNGTLRWLVESYTHATPSLASLLRLVDKAMYSFLEEFTPTTGSSVQPLIGPESYNAPVIRRYREYLVDRYQPPSTKNAILLLPCSARKPYSDSRSHKRIQMTIEQALGNRSSSLAEIILTSPLGVVPREIERGFPQGYYDIPVTGVWDAEETGIAAELLNTHLSKFDSNVPIIAHVSGGYQGIIRRAEPHLSQKVIYTTNNESATSRVALENLKHSLQEISADLSLKGGRPTLLEDTLRATADFQFGLGAGELLVPQGAKVGGKVYGTIICREANEQLCAFIGSTGTISLTLAGARKISRLKRYWTRFDGDKLKGSTLFAIGVSEADESIRPGDEVIILDPNDNVIGVGRSEMSGQEMCDFENGRAVSIRHKEE